MLCVCVCVRVCALMSACIGCGREAVTFERHEPGVDYVCVCVCVGVSVGISFPFPEYTSLGTEHSVLVAYQEYRR